MRKYAGIAGGRAVAIMCAALVAILFVAGCEQKTAEGSAAPLPAGHGQHAAMPANHPAIGSALMQSPGRCPYTPAAATPSCCSDEKGTFAAPATVTAPAAPAQSTAPAKAVAASCPAAAMSCPMHPQGCPQDATMKNCAQCEAAAAKTAAARPAAAPKTDDGLNVDGKIAGAPPVACTADGICTDGTALHLDAVEGTGEKAAPCCTAKPAFGQAAATPAAEPIATAPTEKVQPQAPAAMKPAAGDGCSACDGR